jgi:hypothetical protein
MAAQVPTVPLGLRNRGQFARFVKGTEPDHSNRGNPSGNHHDNRHKPSYLRASLDWNALGIISDKPGAKPSSRPRLLYNKPFGVRNRYWQLFRCGAGQAAALADKNGVSVSNGRCPTVAQADSMPAESLSVLDLFGSSHRLGTATTVASGIELGGGESSSSAAPVGGGKDSMKVTICQRSGSGNFDHTGIPLRTTPLVKIQNRVPAVARRTSSAHRFGALRLPSAVFP